MLNALQLAIRFFTQTVSINITGVLPVITGVVVGFDAPTNALLVLLTVPFDNHLANTIILVDASKITAIGP